MAGSISEIWRNRGVRLRLEGEICANGHPIIPPRDVCPICASQTKTLYQFSGKGEIYSYTTVYAAPEGYEDQIPYTVAIIGLAEGPFVTAQITDVDNDKIKIGQKVEMVTRKLRVDGERGVITYGFKFRPTLASAE